MAANEDTPNIGPLSTTFRFKRVKVSTAPQAQGAVGGSRRFRGLARYNMAEKVVLTMRYKGGSECWISVEARGRQAMYAGSVQLIDMLQEVCQNV